MELLRQLEEQKRTIEALQQQRQQAPPASSPSASSWQPIFIPCDLNQPSSSSSHAFETIPHYPTHPAGFIARFATVPIVWGSANPMDPAEPNCHKIRRRKLMTDEIKKYDRPGRPVVQNTSSWTYCGNSGEAARHIVMCYPDYWRDLRYVYCREKPNDREIRQPLSVFRCGLASCRSSALNRPNLYTCAPSRFPNATPLIGAGRTAMTSMTLSTRPTSCPPLFTVASRNWLIKPARITLA